MKTWTINRKALVAGAVSTVVVGGALLPAFAFAQTPEASPTAEATATAEGTADATDTQEKDGSGFCISPGGRGFRIFGSDEVAAALGVTTDELHAALEAAREQVGPRERSSEVLTDEQREAEREAHKAALYAAVAAELGVTAEEVQAAVESALPTDEEIEAHRAEAEARLRERLDEAVAEGRLTQEQADEILEHMGDGIPRGRGFRFAPAFNLDAPGDFGPTQAGPLL